MSTLSTRVRTLTLLAVLAAGVTLLHTLTARQKAVPAQAVYAECADGVDNDRDGFIDYPQDDGCDDLHDELEGPFDDGIFISMSDGRETVRAGDSLIYGIKISSDRPDPTHVDVRFFLPHQTNLVNASNDGRLEGEYVVWRDVYVSPGRSRRLSVSVHVNPHSTDGQLIVAEVYSDKKRVTDSTRVLGLDLPYSAQPQLKLSVTDGKTFALPEEILNYRIHASNPTPYPQTVDIRSQVPSQLNILEVSGPHRKDRRSIVWPDVYLEPGQAVEFNLSGYVEREVPEYYALTLKVSAGIVNAVDTTSISGRGLVNDALVVTLTDNQQATAPGELLDYQVVLENPSNVVITNLDVNAALPPHTEFIGADQGGHWTGSNIRWDNLTVSERGQRVLHYKVRVRTDARWGASIKAGVVVAGTEAVDITDIGQQPVAQTARRTTSQRPLLSKTANRREVKPGDTVRYTVRLRNTTDQPLRNVQINDTFEANTVQITNPGTANQRLAPNHLGWNIPNLEPGQEWSAHYEARVSPHAPHAMQINNMVTAGGEGLDQLSLNQQVGVLTKLPRTGAGMDAIVLLMTSVLAIAPTVMQVRRKVTL